MRRPASPPSLRHISDGTSETIVDILSLGIGPTPRGKYLHWDQIRHLEPPEGLSHEQWWYGIKFARAQIVRPLPIIDADRNQFGLALTPQILEALHNIDSRCSGRIAMPEQVVNPATRERFLFRSLVEEAITSSQLEGASTTRKNAIEMFRSGRQPRDKSEQMIFNNMKAMEFIRAHQDEQLTPELVLRIHQELAVGTLASDAVGRIQEPGVERVNVVSNTTGEILHVPPPAEQLPGLLDKMCKFANAEGEDEFLHPAVRAILLYFWLGYIHPFEDGNGRTARALFYWAMLHRGYWLFEFISISTILRRASAQYGRSYIYTESDANDATYFVIYQLDVIQNALKALENYLVKKTKQIEEAETLLLDRGDFNYRQFALLSYALRNPDAEFTLQSHRVSHGIAYATARADLLDLCKQGFLDERRIGRAAHFFPGNKLYALSAR